MVLVSKGLLMNYNIWCIDREDLASGQALAYVINKTMPDCSEFGSIGVEPCNGGIVRTW